MLDSKKRIEKELEQAEAARRSGNEGMARVCARRAAGIAIEEYLQRKGHPWPKSSAIECLRLLRDAPHTTQKARQVCDHLLMRVTTEHDLPIPADLVSETRWLIAHLLNE